MNIGAASKLCGLSARMIRHYERTGVLPAPARTASGYRRYAPADIERLRFIRNARTLDFNLREIAQILRFRDQGGDCGARLRQMIEAKLKTVADQASRLEAAKASLQQLYDIGAPDQRERAGSRCVG